MKHRGNQPPFDRDGDDRFRPQMGRRQPSDHARTPTFRALMLRAIQKHGGVHFGARRSQSRRGLVAVREPPGFSRRCVIKGRYVSMTRHGQKAAKLHLAYLERDGVERDGSPGRLYGPDESFTVKAFDVPIREEQRQFRFIVSPQDGDRLNLTDFARQFMSQVEKDTGRSLIWAAVNHYNTDNPHVHIVIRGVDRDGDDLRIDGRYIGREMRWRAQEILTRELGPRSELDLAQERSADIMREAFTPIDRMLAGYLSQEGALTSARLAGAPSAERAACLGRLDTLERLRLAHREPAGSWRLQPGWDAVLVDMGSRAEALERLARVVPVEMAPAAFTPAQVERPRTVPPDAERPRARPAQEQSPLMPAQVGRPSIVPAQVGGPRAVPPELKPPRAVPVQADRRHVLEVGRPFETFDGIVRGIGLHDELGGAMFVAVVTPARAAYYVPVRPEVAPTLRIGQPVRVSSPTESWVKSTDLIIARFTQQNGNTYDPAVHRRALEALRTHEAPGTSPSPAELVTANVRRLERLERFGLVTRLSEGRWRVPPDLVMRLEARQQSHPRYQITVELLGRDLDLGRGRGRGMSR